MSWLPKITFFLSFINLNEKNLPFCCPFVKGPKTHVRAPQAEP